MNELPITIRPYEASDRPFVLDSWQKSFLGQSRAHPHGQGPLSRIRRGTYFREQEQVIDACLGAPLGETFVAVHAEEPDVNIAWVCGNRHSRTLHFVYVEALWREQRVGSRLMFALFAQGAELRFPGDPVKVTHWTRLYPYYKPKWNLEYNPFLLYEVMRG